MSNYNNSNNYENTSDNNSDYAMDDDNTFYHEANENNYEAEQDYDYGEDSEDNHHHSHHEDSDDDEGIHSHGDSEDDNEGGSRYRNKDHETSDHDAEDAEDGSHSNPFDDLSEGFNPTAFFQQFANNSNTASSGRRNLNEMLPGLLSMLNGRRMPGGTGTMSARETRIHKLVDNVVSANEDPYIAMESLKELSESMLMMNQIVVDRIIPTEKLINGLVNVLSSPFLEGELELQMQGCRCLYNLFEVNPESISMAVDKDIIPILKNKLAEINFIDLAEQVLETLEYISRLNGKDILKSGGLTFYIQYYDFFTIHAQRKAIAIVANACARVEPDDFDTIQEVFDILKPTFQNVSDQNILSRILNILYGSCSGLNKDNMLEKIFTSDIVERLLQLTSNADIVLEDKLKCLDILSVLVGNSRLLSKIVICTSDISNVLLCCLQNYSKNNHSALHENLMFVPKAILLAISRFISLLFPPETEQLLSLDKPRYDGSFESDERIKVLLTGLTPLFVEIYMNSMDFSVRKYVLITLLRFISCITPELSKKIKIEDELIRLIGSALAQDKANVLTNEKVSTDLGMLMLGVLSLINMLIMKFGDRALSLLNREGIFDLIQSFSEIFAVKDKENLFHFEEEESDSPSEDESEYEEDDGYDGFIGADLDIPNERKPRKIKFHIFRSMRSDAIVFGIADECERLSSYNNVENTDNDGLKQIKAVIQKLNQTHIDPNSFDECVTFWKSIKECIFCEDFTLSGFEFISTGLASSLVLQIGSFSQTSDVGKRALIEVFGDKLVEMVNILQSALTRVETFDVVDCGLQDDESGMASLGRQITIELIPDNEVSSDKYIRGLKSTFISIHCIASFKTCSEFIKSRLLNASFVDSLIGRNSDENNEELKAIKNLKDSDFDFSINGKSITNNDTIFGAIFKHLKNNKGDMKELWAKSHAIKYKVSLQKLNKIESIEDLQDTSDVMDDNAYETVNEIHTEVDANNDDDIPIPSTDDAINNIYLMQDYQNNEPTPAGDIMIILKFLKANMDNSEIFINSKLSAKLSKQLDEPLIIASGALPEWTLHLTREFSFLFPFESRMFFLQCVSFGYGRLIQLWKNRNDFGKDIGSDNPILQLGRVTRHKLRIARSKVFLTGLKILDKYGSNPSILEMEYQEEVGTGLGPTLEFYATMSREFSKKSLGMWRVDNYNSKIDENNEDPDENYVSQLLFPIPLQNSNEKVGKIKELFSYLGIFIARSMLDNRIVDFNFNKLFFTLTHELARYDELPKYMENINQSISIISCIDKQIGNSLKYLYEHKNNAEKIEELYLTFILPGTDIDLIENGKNINVTAENIIQYIELLISYIIGSGIKTQLQAFIDGFSTVFPYCNLLALTPEEIVDIFGRVEEDWSAETLYNSIVSDHGYTMDSPTIHDLISIMTELNSKDKKLFLQFLTGSPRLPFGGFKALKPKLTVVLKHAEDNLSSDQYLPSVMTCANYLKLPKYGSKEIMRSRIQQAIEEGAGAFLLS